MLQWGPRSTDNAVCKGLIKQHTNRFSNHGMSRSTDAAVTAGQVTIHKFASATMLSHAEPMLNVCAVYCLASDTGIELTQQAHGKTPSLPRCLPPFARWCCWNACKQVDEFGTVLRCLCQVVGACANWGSSVLLPPIWVRRRFPRHHPRPGAESLYIYFMEDSIPSSLIFDAGRAHKISLTRVLSIRKMAASRPLRPLTPYLLPSRP